MISNILRRILPRAVRTALRDSLLPHEEGLVYRLLSGTSPGSKVMVDVGAHFGSTLEPFAKDGWTVYAFEPDKENRKKLEQLCSRFDAVTVDSRAVSNTIESNVPFYRSEISAGISGLSAFHASHTAAGTVETTTLAAFCREHAVEVIDFLKIDTEGHDLFVLKGIEWDTIKPSVIMCEFEDSKTTPLGYSYHDMAGYLVDKGYAVQVSEWYPVLQYGGNHRWRRFEHYPCELADPRAWGNLIAVLDGGHLRELDRLFRLVARRWKIGSFVRRF